VLTINSSAGLLLRQLPPLADMAVEPQNYCQSQLKLEA